MVQPSEVSSRLGVTPTRAFSPGAAVGSRAGRHIRTRGVWAVTFPIGESVEDTVQEILGGFESRASDLNLIRHHMKATISFAIWWDPPRGYGGFSVTAGSIARMCALVDRLDFYYPGSPVESGGPSESDPSLDEPI